MTHQQNTAESKSVSHGSTARGKENDIRKCSNLTRTKKNGKKRVYVRPCGGVSNSCQKDFAWPPFVGEEVGKDAG